MRNENVIQLGKLEFQITNLIESIETLKMENMALKRKLMEHEHEQRQLKNKNSKAADKIKTIISKLREQIK